MRLVYSDMPIPSLQGVHSVFLVGPSPRSPIVDSWRPEAIQALQDLKYDGVVLVPEWSDWRNQVDYLSQVAWERAGLEKCSVIAAWVPRELEHMPAFTTNVEFGRYVTSGKLFYGRPELAPNNEYLDWLYETDTGRKPLDNLTELMKTVISHV